MRFYDFEKKQPRKDELILIKTTNIGKPECYQIARYKCDNTNGEFQFVIADFKGTEWVMFSRGKTMSWAKLVLCREVDVDEALESIDELSKEVYKK